MQIYFHVSSNTCTFTSTRVNQHVFLQVEFPEARIYEETLQVLLYENRDKGPNMELMQATKGHNASTPGYHSDEEGEERLERMERLRRK